jgi:DNA polymerase-3 subunit alpha (Gram-positive type)
LRKFGEFFKKYIKDFKFNLSDTLITAVKIDRDEKKIMVIVRSSNEFDKKQIDADSEKIKEFFGVVKVVIDFEKETGVGAMPEADFSATRVIYGKAIDDNIISIMNLKPGEFCVWGDIFDVESNFNKRERDDIVYARITDYTDSINLKVSKKTNEKLFGILEKLQDKTVLVYGEVFWDKFFGKGKDGNFIEKKELAMLPKSISEISKKRRLDVAKEKRVELHLHTSMSAMDGITPVEKIVRRAYEWGHPAVAITDHGVAQSYPDAMNASKKLIKDGKNPDFKIIYGIENYFVDDSDDSSEIADVPIDSRFVCFDFETTGFSAENERIVEIGAVIVENIPDFLNGKKDAFNEFMPGRCMDFQCFVNPKRHVSQKITELTGITDEMLSSASEEREAIIKFIEFCGKNAVLVAHNAKFDAAFLRAALKRNDIEFDFKIIDTIPIAKSQISVIKNYKLGTISAFLSVPDFSAHRANDDSRALAMILIKLIGIAMKNNAEISNIGDVLKNSDAKKAFAFHQTILVKNQTGLKNLYRLISMSNLKYFYKKPRIPKSELVKLREGLIVGTACEQGELFSAVFQGQPMDKLLEIAKFYDYLEIQPLGNNMFLLREEKVQNEEQILDFNRKIVQIGETLGIPVVATGDVHFLDAYESEFRKIIMLAQGFEDGANQAPLYFKTTDEMLEEFSYLGTEKAYEVVVKNPRKIAAMVENIKPIPDGVYPPEIPGAEDELVKIVTENTKKRYGENLPQIVKERLERELNSITKYGYSVLYMVAQKLVTKSIESGFLVGSRGSVGSSFVATMAGISEVNPLVPHYVCGKCLRSEFITDGSYGSGYDLPEKICPNCGEQYFSDGQDIPFETFLGFEGDKTPDIDLNFSGEYQDRAHRHTEEIFGKENVFKAGTIGTLAEKSAMGFIKKVMEEKGVKFCRAEQKRLAIGCSGVKRTTGQHPGGMVVVPQNMEIYDFCPVQHPANDQNSENITTHFDFHSIHDTICKLDELGHDVPTIYKYLEEYTGTKIADVPMNDRKVMSLFLSTKALGVTPEEIGSKIGTFSMPEVGTSFVRQMSEEAKPKTFADLVQIAGLSHGTDVWHGNARDLIKNGVCNISEVIGTRDNIMVYLIKKGIDKKTAFRITEATRKGKFNSSVSEEDIKMMKDHDVPDWYIASCSKIKYMFPKAHAAAYMISTLKFGWYKVYKPLEYYAAYFTVRGEDVDGSLVMKGSAAINARLKEIESKGKEASIKENASISTLQILREAFARNIKFLPIDIYKSDKQKFLIDDGAIRLPLSSLAGLGGAAAENIQTARVHGKFISITDLRDRTKLNKTVADTMKKAGILAGMQESNQISFFKKS